MFEPKKITPFPQELRYRWVPVLPGGQLVGWVLCPPVGIDSHFDKKAEQTKPCRAWMTKGKLDCPWGPSCKPREIAYWALWVPSVRERLVVTLSRQAALAAEPIQVGSAVRLFRSTAKNNPPIQVTPLQGVDDPSMATTGRMRKRPAEDIRSYLLHLWQDQELCRVCGAEFRPSRASERNTE